MNGNRHALQRPMCALICTVITITTCRFLNGKDEQKKPIEAPRWTAFKQLTTERIPEEDWDAFYGFSVDGDSTVVEDRFLYPIPNPPLFHGDRIISVKSKSVETKEQLFQELNSYPSSPIWIRIERASRGKEPKKLRIEVARCDKELLRKGLGQVNQTWSAPEKVPSLVSSDIYSFGGLSSYTSAEIIGYCDDLKDSEGRKLPVLVAQPIAAPGSSRAEFADRLKLLKEFGDFVVLDKRNAHRVKFAGRPYFNGILQSDLRHDLWKVGEHIRLSAGTVLVEEPMRIKVGGKDRKVSVLTVFDFDYDNEY